MTSAVSAAHRTGTATTSQHELSGLYDVAHGAGLSVIMPAWMQHVYQHDIPRFAQFAVRVWGCDMHFDDPEATAKEGIARFRAFLTAIGMPATFRTSAPKRKTFRSW